MIRKTCQRLRMMKYNGKYGAMQDLKAKLLMICSGEKSHSTVARLPLESDNEDSGFCK